MCVCVRGGGEQGPAALAPTRPWHAPHLASSHSACIHALPSQLYVIGVLVVFWCASLGCLMSIIMGNNSALVASVAILMVIGG